VENFKDDNANQRAWDNGVGSGGFAVNQIETVCNP